MFKSQLFRLSIRNVPIPLLSTPPGVLSQRHGPKRRGAGGGPPLRISEPDPDPRATSRPLREVPLEGGGYSRKSRSGKSWKGTNRVSTKLSLQMFMLFDRGTFRVLPLTYFDLPKSARAYLFLQSVEIHISFAAAPFVSTPFVRNQGAPVVTHTSESRPVIRLFEPKNLDEVSNRIPPTSQKRSGAGPARTFLAQISQFELFELIPLLKLDKRFSIEQFEATVPVNSTLPTS